MVPWVILCLNLTCAPTEQGVNRPTDSLFIPFNPPLGTPSIFSRQKWVTSIEAICSLMRDGWPGGPGHNWQAAAELYEENIFLLSSRCRSHQVSSPAPMITLPAEPHPLKAGGGIKKDCQASCKSPNLNLPSCLQGLTIHRAKKTVKQKSLIVCRPIEMPIGIDIVRAKRTANEKSSNLNLPRPMEQQPQP